MDWYPLWNSLRIALISCAAVFFLGIFAAYYIARLPRVVKGVLDVLLTLPMVLPPTVVGYFLLLLFGAKRPLGIFFMQQFGVKLVMNWYSAIFASIVVAFPLMYRTARGAFESFDETLAWSAQALGQSGVWIFWRVRMPCCRQGILAGTVLAFARALGEYGATSMIAGYTPGKTATIATTVYQLWRTNDEAGAMRWVLVDIVISAVVLLAVNLLEKKQKAGERFLVERNEKLQNFTENIAHQIKTPLTALSIALDRLEESGENRELLERCFEQIERIRSFISKLMTISRMEAGKIIMTEQDINVNSMLCDVVNQLPKNDCNITVECDDKDYCINADEEWIREAFINIIQNSSELCETVKVKAVCRDDKCIVNIKDNGSGFEEDLIPYVFDRFETTGSAAAGHAGIGLNLSRLIIEAHHGTVDVRNNEDGKGAVIRVQIPRYVLKRKAEL